jgi:hypothetical protein
VNHPTIERAVVRLVELWGNRERSPFAYERTALEFEWGFELAHGLVQLRDENKRLSVVCLTDEGLAAVERILAAGCDVLAARKAGA